ncbi:hypothetical protein, partial [Escherichia coli]|uniref:hypothetical protein n=1 Tax=Escherichia coli TaxID=562 RepID=UPI001BE42E35
MDREDDDERGLRPRARCIRGAARGRVESVPLVPAEGCPLGEHFLHGCADGARLRDHERAFSGADVSEHEWRLVDGSYWTIPTSD